VKVEGESSWRYRHDDNQANLLGTACLGHWLLERHPHIIEATMTKRPKLTAMKLQVSQIPTRSQKKRTHAAAKMFLEKTSCLHWINHGNA